MRVKIYALYDEHHRLQYIGMTKFTLEGRLEAHLQDAWKGNKQNKRCLAIREMLRQGVEPTIELLTEVNNGYGAEIAYIKHYRKLGYDLWNETDGGEGNPDHLIKTKTKIKDEQEWRQKKERYWNSPAYAHNMREQKKYLEWVEAGQPN